MLGKVTNKQKLGVADADKCRELFLRNFDISINGTVFLSFNIIIWPSNPITTFEILDSDQNRQTGLSEQFFNTFFLMRWVK